MKIYLAAPFFSERELQFYHRALEILRRKGLSVYAPLEHQADRSGLSKREWADLTFRRDLDAIGEADAVLMLFYGWYSDSGTAWECGYSFAIGKKVIAVHLHDGKSNCMIRCSCHASMRRLEELETYDFINLPQRDIDAERENQQKFERAEGEKTS